MKDYGYSGNDNQQKDSQKVIMWPTFLGLGIFFLIFIGRVIIQMTDSMQVGMNVIPYIGFLIMGVAMIVAVVQLSKRWKEDQNLPPKVACGRGPNRGAESLPAGMGGHDPFSIKKAMLEMSIGEVYHVLNAEGTKILEAKLDMSGFRRYSVKNNYGECVGTIQHSGGFTDIDSYEVTIGQESPFTVRQILGMEVRYNVNGLDYEVTSDMRLSHIDIRDLDGNVVAGIQGKQLRNGWRDGNHSDVFISPNAENNIYILFLALTLFIEKENKED